MIQLFDLERTKGIIEKVVSSEGMEVVDIEFKGSLNNRLLRIYIDKPAGVSHEDCAFISNQVGTLLDIEDIIPGSYVLEVSSPGLTRKLTKESDYKRFHGRLVKIQTRKPVDGMTAFRGMLLGLEGDSVMVETENARLVQIPLKSIARAHLDIDF
jgi:ribosome maturation factor RimP